MSWLSTTLLLAAELWSVGVFLFSLQLGEGLVDYVRRNQLPSAPVPLAEPWQIAIGALTAAVATVLGSWCLGGEVRYRLARLVQVFCPLVVLAPLPALLTWRLWTGRELPFLLSVLVVVFAFKGSLGVMFRVARETWDAHAGATAWLPRTLAGVCAIGKALPKWVPLAIVCLAAALYAAFFGYHTILHHRNVLSASLDLGLEDNLVWNAMHGAKLFKSSPLGGPNASHLGFHATWFSFLLVPFYAIRPGAEALLLIQAVLLGGAAIPLYLLGARYVGRPMACVVALAYILYPGLHGANLYDFHYLPLGNFFIWFVLYCVDTRRWALGTILVLVTLSVREDVAAALAVAGGFLLLSGRRPRAGIALLLAGGGYFLLMKGVVMRRAMGGSDAFVHQYKLLIPEGDRGFAGVVKTILSNPIYTLSTLLERQKLVYFLEIMAPLALLPLRRPIGLWCCVPGFVFTLLSTEYPPLLMISFQYTAYWSIHLFPAILANLRWIRLKSEGDELTRRTRMYAWVGALGLSTVLLSHQFGALLQQNTAWGGFGPYHFGVSLNDLQRRADLRKLLDQIPSNAKVVATENVVPQISNRPDAYTLRTGTFDAEYLVFHHPCSGSERTHVNELLRPGTFGVIEQSGSYVLAKRGYRTELNSRYVGMGGGNRDDE